jgi:hypothetical protein
MYKLIITIKKINKIIGGYLHFLFFLVMGFQVYKEVVEKTNTTPGAKVENNKFCLSVHYRCVDEKVGIEHQENINMLLLLY